MGSKQSKNQGNLNAVRHGFRSAVALIRGEDPKAFQSLSDEIAADLKPAGRLELELVERVVSCIWRLRRIGNLEAEVLDELARQAELAGIADATSWIEEQATGRNPRPWTRLPEPPDAPVLDDLTDLRRKNLLDGVGNTVGKGLVSGRADAVLTTLRRYESAIDRSLNAALAQLERIQSARKREENEKQAQPTKAADPESTDDEINELERILRMPDPRLRQPLPLENLSHGEGRGGEDRLDLPLGRPGVPGRRGGRSVSRSEHR